MLSYKKDQLLKKYSETEIKATVALLKKFKYRPENNFLIISGYHIFFTPLVFKLREFSFLVSLTETEISFFSKFKKDLCSLRLSFIDPENNKTHQFFIKGEFPEIEKCTLYKDSWIFTFSFKSESDFYLKTFLLMSELISQYKILYSNSNPAVFGSLLLTDILKTDSILVSSERVKIGFGTILSISVNNMKIVMNLSDYELKPGDKLTLTSRKGNNSFILNGRIKELYEWKEDSLFTVISTDLDFHIDYIDRISPYLNVKEIEEIDNPDEITTTHEPDSASD